MIASWQESYDKPRQCVKKQRYHLANKGSYSQNYIDKVEWWLPRTGLREEWGVTV